MKFCLVFFTVLGVFLAEALEDDANDWEDYKNRYNKKYSTDEEDNQHFIVFKTNLDHLKQQRENYHSGRGGHLSRLNEWADTTEEEFAKTHPGIGYTPYEVLAIASAPTFQNSLVLGLFAFVSTVSFKLILM